MLDYYAKHSGMVVLSVGYRLAPEDPYPKGNEDCFDIGEYLVDKSEKEFGAPLRFITGDSAGAHLSVLTAFHLLKSRPDFDLKGLVLSFGAYNLTTLLPGAHTFSLPLVLDGGIMQKYIDTYLPDTTVADRTDPWISPVYANLAEMKLPPAFFAIGTQDPLVDDNILMSTKWSLSGAESVLKFYPGAPHGFTFFPIGGTEQTLLALEDIITFVSEKL
ncbi:alpha/beta-hydrolase [Polychaeton citri CBS 116435]|uniref:Alpha/beta-hydrolase n=1 Tax=Polychaeton citri CBS 116435 TaxID=1314669 RepID=A0A9P4UNW6_9PEZI|nr:alpha/beta-hydrolase [Polychaeton citri CBS 116435]